MTTGVAYKVQKVKQKGCLELMSIPSSLEHSTVHLDGWFSQLGVQRQTKNNPDRPILPSLLLVAPPHKICRTVAMKENSLTLVLKHVMTNLTTKGVLQLITAATRAIEMKSKFQLEI